MNEVLVGVAAVKVMNELSEINSGSNDTTDEIWGIAIDGNLAQLHEEFTFDNDEEIAVAIHECGGNYGLDEYANDNSDLYNMINAGMRILLMQQHAEYI